MKRLCLPTFFLLGIVLSLTPLTASGRAEGAIQKTWDYADIRTLVVDADRQDVVVREGGPRLSGRMVGESGDEVSIVREGGTLTLTFRGDGGWFSWRRSARVELSVPPGLALDVTTASGAILVQVPLGQFRARSASGDIEAARGGTASDVDSTSGTVRLRAFTGPVRASTLSGNLLLEDISGDIQAATLSGNLEGRGLSPADRSRFTTVSGNADLQFEGGADAFVVSTESVSGSLQIGERRSEGQLSSGEHGPVVVVKSVSGDILVR